MSALTLASREKLDNLTWVVNCNLQRLDGPVRAATAASSTSWRRCSPAPAGASSSCLGLDWDGLFARRDTARAARAFAHTVDGQFQTFAAKDGRYNRDHFFGQNPQLAALAQASPTPSRSTA